jgi:hypothetical protein
MPKGISLHIGLNKVDKNHYGNIAELKAAVNDAVVWEKFAESQGYTTTHLHDNEATATQVISLLKSYSKELQPGDILMLTYAGHGGSIRNDRPSAADNERFDQTWCLYDRQLLDDELYEAFEAFQKAVRIIVVSDSCHSGTVTKEMALDLNELLSAGIAEGAKARGWRSRKLNKKQQSMIAMNFKETVYKPIQDKYKIKSKARGVQAAVKLLAACQDDEETLDGDQNGIFTEAFMELFKDPAFTEANGERLIAGIRNRYFFPAPRFFEYGSIIPSFDYSFPFTIDIPEPTRVTGYREPDLSFSEPHKREFTIDAGLGIVEIERAAVLLIEADESFDDKTIGGKDVVILSDQKRSGQRLLTVELPDISHQFAWSAAHAIQTELKKKGIIANVEPQLTINPAQRERLSREGDANNPDYIMEWPPSLLQGKVGIGWHLDEEHSQLAAAVKKVLTEHPDAHVTVAHVDTGYNEAHKSLPSKLRVDKAYSFVDKENPNQAIDKAGSGGQEGHGLGTLVLFAGGKATKDQTYNEFEGDIGGVPFADVIPIRVSESVVIFNDRNFCDAIDYAIAQGCEVLSMSMAGKPSQRMAKAVNRAYEAGLVLVTAASNCWYKGMGAALPKCVLFPAAFERVIAATGAMYDHKPYDVNFLQKSRFNIGTKYMQGSWGPPARMTKAIAGYTPNTPWASSPLPFLRSGGGTSSATPQVAATAAVYIAHKRKELEEKGYYTEGNKWKKVEAVRHALFTSAAKDEVFGEWKKYYGNGIIRALNALDVAVADESQLQKAPDAESTWFGALELIGSFFLRRKLFRSDMIKPDKEALATELIHLLQTDPQFYALFSKLDFTSEAEIGVLMNDEKFRNQVLQSPYASNYLKEAMTE